MGRWIEDDVYDYRDDERDEPEEVETVRPFVRSDEYEPGRASRAEIDAHAESQW